MTFPDFQRQMEWCLSYITQMSLKTCWKYGYYTNHDYLMCNTFWALTTFIFQCDFKCKTCLARYDHQYLMCEESCYTMLAMKKKRI